MIFDFVLPIVNGIVVGVLAYSNWRMHKAVDMMHTANRMLTDQVIAMGFATTMMLDRSCGMIACDVCDEPLRPGQNLRADIGPEHKILAHAGCE